MSGTKAARCRRCGARGGATRNQRRCFGFRRRRADVGERPHSSTLPTPVCVPPCPTPGDERIWGGASVQPIGYVSVRRAAPVRAGFAVVLELLQHHVLGVLLAQLDRACDAPVPIVSLSGVNMQRCPVRAQQRCGAPIAMLSGIVRKLSGNASKKPPTNTSASERRCSPSRSTMTDLPGKSFPSRSGQPRIIARPRRDP